STVGRGGFRAPFARGGRPAALVCAMASASRRALAGAASRIGEPVLPQVVGEVSRIDSEERGRLGFATFGSCESFDDQASLELFDAAAKVEIVARAGRALGERHADGEDVSEEI